MNSEQILKSRSTALLVHQQTDYCFNPLSKKNLQNTDLEHSRLAVAWQDCQLSASLG